MIPLHRLAAAPISWGVCEVPGWGFQMPAERVVAEMAQLGLTASETGPEGYLGDDLFEADALTKAHAVRLIGGFVPVAFHLPGADAVVAGAARALAAIGADVLVMAAASGDDGYDTRPTLDDAAWTTLLSGLDAARETCSALGLRCTLHPHAGTVVERRDEIERVLVGSGVELCLDTGHLMIGGTDPLELARAAGDRIGHVHLKDVDAALIERVARGELGYAAAVAEGLYRPLGAGDADIRGFVALTERAGYDGWYVLEQDLVLSEEPPAGEGPIGEVRACVDFLSADTGA